MSDLVIILRQLPKLTYHKKGEVWKHRSKETSQKVLNQGDKNRGV